MGRAPHPLRVGATRRCACGRAGRVALRSERSADRGARDPKARRVTAQCGDRPAVAAPWCTVADAGPYAEPRARAVCGRLRAPRTRRAKARATCAVRIATADRVGEPARVGRTRCRARRPLRDHAPASRERAPPRGAAGSGRAALPAGLTLRPRPRGLLPADAPASAARRVRAGVAAAGGGSSHGRVLPLCVCDDRAVVAPSAHADVIRALGARAAAPGRADRGAQRRLVRAGRGCVVPETARRGMAVERCADRRAAHQPRHRLRCHRRRPRRGRDPLRPSLRVVRTRLVASRRGRRCSGCRPAWDRARR
jgi:hypothetical protein